MLVEEDVARILHEDGAIEIFRNRVAVSYHGCVEHVFLSISPLLTGEADDLPLLILWELWNVDAGHVGHGDRRGSGGWRHVVAQTRYLLMCASRISQE